MPTTQIVRLLLLMFAIVFVGCLFGIYSRPAGFLASVWPANALMLVFLLKTQPQLQARQQLWLWLSGATGFMAADLMTGASLLKAVVLNTANLVSVAVAFRILAKQPASVLSLQQASSVLIVVLAAVLASAAAGVVGGLANPLLFNGTVVQGFMFWWVAEVVNYVAILPILLSAMVLPDLKRTLTWPLRFSRKFDWLPAVSVLLGFSLALLFGGPGAIAFPLLALLWCALVYPVFVIALLTFLYSVLLLTLISQVYPNSMAEAELISVRLGIAINALAPVLLSVVTQNRNALLAKLRHLSLYDGLTGVGSRAAFAEDATQLLKQAQDGALLMLDLDHFKKINDSFGHAAGDQVLKAAASRISQSLRSGDLVGRWGGEEFVVLLPATSAVVATEIAERIRHTVAAQPVLLVDGGSVHLTVSIGLSLYQHPLAQTLDELLAQADGALYQCKAKGRNRVELAQKEKAAYSSE